MSPPIPTAQGTVRLLEADPTLAEGLTPEAELLATDELLAPLERLPKGVWKPPAEAGRGHLGFLVLEGMLMREVRVGESASVELISRGDLLRPWQEDPSSYSTASWTVLEEAELAVLEPAFARPVSRHPELVAVLVGRMMCRARNLAVHWAIANTVGLEKRILMLFRHLAERWGRVTPDGFAIPVRITHQMVADLVGARRPSATTAISSLAEAGALSRLPEGGWLLRDP